MQISNTNCTQSNISKNAEFRDTRKLFKTYSLYNFECIVNFIRSQSFSYEIILNFHHWNQRAYLPFFYLFFFDEFLRLFSIFWFYKPINSKSKDNILLTDCLLLRFLYSFQNLIKSMTIIETIIYLSLVHREKSRTAKEWWVIIFS